MTRLHADLLPGAGAPLVLLHGVLDDPAVWSRVAHRLVEAGRAVVLVHARAHGRSPAFEPGMDWSPRADADDVMEVLREHWPDGVHLVGHSRGATSASWIAAEEPRLARSLAVVASPPMASEVFRAAFRRRLEDAGRRDLDTARDRAALEYLATIPEDDFPQHALRRYRGPALVVEAEDDPLYSPTQTMFWRMFLPYAAFERVPGGHRFFAERDEDAAWLAARLLRHVQEAEA